MFPGKLLYSLLDGLGYRGVINTLMLSHELINSAPDLTTDLLIPRVLFATKATHVHVVRVDAFGGFRSMISYLRRPILNNLKALGSVQHFPK